MKTKLQIIQEKRGEYTRKRRKKYLRLKNIKKYKRKKIVKLTSDNKPLYSGIAHQPSIIHPGGKKLSWWRRLLELR